MALIEIDGLPIQNEWIFHGYVKEPDGRFLKIGLKIGGSPKPWLLILFTGPMTMISAEPA